MPCSFKNSNLFFLIIVKTEKENMKLLSLKSNSRIREKLPGYITVSGNTLQKKKKGKRNHFRELGDAAELTWTQTPGGESQEHQADQLDFHSCHHLLEIPRQPSSSTSDRLKGGSLWCFLLPSADSESGWSMRVAWTIPYIYTCRQEDGVMRAYRAYPFRMYPPFISIPPPLPPPLLRGPPPLKVTSPLIAAAPPDFWHTEGVIPKQFQREHTRKELSAQLFPHFLSCLDSKKLSFWFCEAWDLSFLVPGTSQGWRTDLSDSLDLEVLKE